MVAALVPLIALALAQQAEPVWPNGPAMGGSSFPIAVWLQDPANATRYKAAGINLYVGLWQGPTEKQLEALKRAGMPVICDQNAVGLAHKDDPIIVGWLQQDEPDNAQAVKDPATGGEGWGPCVPPQKVVEEYERLGKADPSRPVLLNLGQGVINDTWVGRGSGAKLSDYETYVKGGDIVSFDVYPIAGLDKPNPADFMWYVGAGVERLVKWTGGTKTVWNCLECTRISNGERRASPAQVRAQAWMAIIHGSRGLIYFVHEFKPKFNEWALLDDPEMLKAVTELNAEITRLAPAINAPDEKVGVAIVGGAKADRPPVAAVAKRLGRDSYVFAVGMRNSETRVAFALPRARPGSTVEVIGENRTIPVADGRFEDTFGPYAVRLYRLR
ncbi:MAG: hypothetical protein FJX72_00610 [Armatimonadetes bacterium]|nr:hypothetical protein [Armatimonadota bacterium]